MIIGEKGAAPLKGEEVKVFDGKMGTYLYGRQNGWIGMDLGEGRQQQISRIKFCPTNDTNCIIPGNIYELFYWDDQWISLGKQTAIVVSGINMPLAY